MADVLNPCDVDVEMATQPQSRPSTNSPATGNPSFRFNEAGLKEATMVWQNIDKVVDVVEHNKPVTKKQLLHGVSGCAKPGEMMALMGPSGSGKTTLLNILGGRGLDQTTGDVLINNTKFLKSMKRTIAYVLQEDLFYTELTVLEQLTITSKLRLPDSLSDEMKRKAVNQVIKTLRIEKCKNTQIMLVSGGEKKRTNIGTELLTNPSIMLLDEPTSGLDSNGAAGLISVLREMANDRMTIISSIHQPSSRVFYSFDKLLLLADGHVIYSGAPRNVLAYLSTCGFTTPNDYNPADFLMDLVTETFPGDEEKENGGASAPTKEKTARAVLIETWDNNVSFKEAEDACKVFAATNVTKDSDVSDLKFMASYQTQFVTLFERALIVSRSKVVNNLQIFQTVIMGLLSGLVWFQMEYTENTVQDRASFVFFFGTFWFFMSLFQGMMQFLPERTIMLKERAGGSYHLSAYFLSKTLSETPVRLLLPLIYLIISYWMTSLAPGFDTFLAVAGVQLLAALAGESIGLFIGTATMDYEKAMVIATLVSLALMLTGGYFVENLPIFVRWIRYLSPFKYSYDACLKLVFTRVISCDGGEQLVECVSAVSVPGSTASSALGATESVGMNVAMLLIFIASFRVLSFLSLKYVPHNNGRQ